MTSLAKNDIMNNFMWLPPESIASNLQVAMRDKMKDRIQMIDTAVKLNVDINKHNLLHTAVHLNDLVAVARFVKHNVNIHSLNDYKENLIHICAESGNAHLLRYFIDKGVDINALNVHDQIPLVLAIYNLKYECAKILVERNAEIYVPGACVSTLGSILYIIQDKSLKPVPEPLLEVFKLIVQKIKRMSEYDMEDILTSLDNSPDLIKIILDYHPYLINKYIDDRGMTIPKRCILDNNIPLLNYLIECKHLNSYQDNVTKISFLHDLADGGYVDQVKTLLKFRPKLAKRRCYEGKTAIHHALLSNSHRRSVSDKKIREIINILLESGTDINDRDHSGCRALELAIQYYNVDMVKFLIERGANIHAKRRSRSIYPKSNNDPIGYAIQMGKLSIVKYLISDAKTRIHKTKYNNSYDDLPISSLKYIISGDKDTNEIIKYKDHELPTSLILSLVYNNEDAFFYLMQLDIIRDTLTEQSKCFLLDVALNHGITNKNILYHFAKQEYVDTINFNDPKLIGVYYDKIFERYFPNHVENRKNLLNIMYKFLGIISQMLRLKANKIPQTIRDETDELYDLCAPWSNLINNIVSSMCDILNHHEPDDIQYCMHIIECIKDDANDKEECHKANNHLHELRSLPLMNRLAKIRTTLKSLRILINNQISGPSLSYNTSKGILSEERIRHVLFKLSWPDKQIHYEKMYNMLMDINNVSSHTEDKIIVKNIKTGIISTIYKNNRYNYPRSWFKYYSYNIGKDDKSDNNHIFPFVLDMQLDNVPCYQKFVPDPVNKSGKNKLFYFPGTLSVKNREIKGVYEYFIDSKDVLFHRLFRPIDQLPNSIADYIYFD